MSEDIDSFAEKVKAKHPAYKDVPNAELTQRVLDKHPTYKSLFTNVTDTVGQQLASVVPGVVQSPIGQELTKPIPAMHALGNKISNAIPEPINPPTSSPGAMLQQTAHGVGQLLGGAIGSISPGDVLMMGVSPLEGYLHEALSKVIPAKRQALLLLAEKNPIAALHSGLPIKDWDKVADWVTEMKAKAPSVQEAEVEPVLNTRAKMIIDRSFGIEPKPVNAPKQIAMEPKPVAPEVAPVQEAPKPQQNLTTSSLRNEESDARLAQVQEALPKARPVQMKDWKTEEAPDGRNILSNALPAETLPVSTVAEPWHSKLQQTLDDPKIPNIMPGEGLINTLKNKGVKPEELQWSGLEDFVKGKNKVTKPEVQAFLKENAFKVNEINKVDDVKDSPGEQATDGTHYGEYQLPGGTNYREKLFQLPQTGEGNKKINWVDFPDDLKKAIDLFDTGKYSQQQLDTFAEQKGYDLNLNTGNDNILPTAYKIGTRPSAYQSPHFDEPNILAHTRFNDRKIGKDNVRFVEEVQSDWHQAGREKGYVKNKTELPQGYTVAQVKKENEWCFQVQDEKGLPVSSPSWNGYASTKERAVELAQEALMFHKKGIPDAPFKKTWHELVMKRMIRQAVEEGKDGIAWTTGAQQYKRYPNGGETGKIAMGMKGFYDKMLPDFVNKFTKKWGGQVTEEYLPTAKPIKLTPSQKNDLCEVVENVIQGSSDFNEAKTSIEAATGWNGLTSDVFEDMQDRDPLRRSSGGQWTRDLIRAMGKPDTAEKVHYLKFTPELKRAALKVGFPLFSTVGALEVSKEAKK